MNYYFLVIMLVINVFVINSSAKEHKQSPASNMQDPEVRLKYLQNHDMEIDMAIKYNLAFREIEANDDAVKMKVRLGKSFGEEYNVSVRMNKKSEYGKIKRIKSDKNKFYYEYSGLGINLIMEQLEKTKYLISGSAKVDSRIKKIPKVLLIERIDGREIIYEAEEPYIIIGSDRHSIGVSLNTKEFNKRALGGVVSFILLLHYKNTEAKPSQDVPEPHPQ